MLSPIPPDPVQALRETPPLARRGFTQANQVHQLASASEEGTGQGAKQRSGLLRARTDPRSFGERETGHSLRLDLSGSRAFPQG